MLAALLESAIAALSLFSPDVAARAKSIAALKDQIDMMLGSPTIVAWARTKPLTVVAPVALDALTTYSSYSMPAAKSSVKLIDPNNLDELVALLHNEAKVI